MSYLVLKWIHILSATVLFGTGLGTAFFLFVTHRSRNVQAIAVVSRWVVRADWWFTTPTAVIQPLSGFYLAHLAAYPLTWNWLGWSVIGYAFAGLCWLPVVWIQIQLREMAARAAAEGSALPARYWQLARIWTLLGFPAFITLLGVYWLMVAKPF